MWIRPITFDDGSLEEITAFGKAGSMKSRRPTPQQISPVSSTLKQKLAPAYGKTDRKCKTGSTRPAAGC
jgi:hypothetical protein